MKYFLLMVLATLGINLSAQTNLQYQAHVPFETRSVTFSAYIADDSFNENSHINSDAFWYVEGQVIEVHNGMINTVLENIPDSVFLQNKGNIYVFAYVNGQPLGRLPFHQLPYALHSNVSNFAGRARVANEAGSANTANHADTADYATESGHAFHSDTADFSNVSGRSYITSEVDSNGVGTHAIQNGAVVAEKLAEPAVFSVHIAPLSVKHQHIDNNAVDFNNIEGGSDAGVGTYLTRGASGLVWAENPQHRTSSVSIYTVAPGELPIDSRWVVSRVAVDYNLATLELSPSQGQLITVYNGATANTVTLRASTWNIDTALDCVIHPGSSRTLWYSGTNWVVIQ